MAQNSDGYFFEASKTLASLFPYLFRSNKLQKRKNMTVHLQSFLGINGGLIPGLPVDTKIHRCSSLLCTMV
jgi:hypothetical protein